MELRDAKGMTEQEFLEVYRSKHYPAPYLTADAAVLSEDGDVLLIRRKGHPFMGCWALPGGFVNPNENARTAALRELAEETGILGIPKTAVHEIGLFSDPGRDPRGWVVSDAYLVRVKKDEVRFCAGDDAADAAWIAVGRNGDELVLPEGVTLAFDHGDVLKKAFALRDLLER